MQDPGSYGRKAGITRDGTTSQLSDTCIYTVCIHIYRVCVHLYLNAWNILETIFLLSDFTTAWQRVVIEKKAFCPITKFQAPKKHLSNVLHLNLSGYVYHLNSTIRIHILTKIVHVTKVEQQLRKPTLWFIRAQNERVRPWSPKPITADRNCL